MCLLSEVPLYSTSLALQIVLVSEFPDYQFRHPRLGFRIYPETRE